jgi:xanthosine utilization system XapX-like protein
LTTLEYVLTQLPYVAPMLLVYLVGVVLSLVQLKRITKPAAFALVGCGMLFLITTASPFVQGYIFASRYDRQWSDQEIGLWMGVVAIIRTLLHVTAFSLLLAAIFAGRSATAKPRNGGDADS